MHITAAPASHECNRRRQSSLQRPIRRRFPPPSDDRRRPYVGIQWQNITTSPRRKKNHLIVVCRMNDNAELIMYETNANPRV